MAQIILDSNNNLIQGDFDNATLNNRTKLQTTTTNATTNVYVVPNGSSTSAGVSVANNSSLTNASKIVMATNGTTDTQIISGVNGSGTYLPLSFYTNNALAMQITTGGIISAAGGGIQFPATAIPSANANTLDDYEEGSFTPSLSDGTNSVAIAGGSTYTKIGRMVYVAVNGYNTNFSALSASAGLRITGLPFTATAVAASQFNLATNNLSTYSCVAEIYDSTIAYVYLANNTIDYNNATRNNLVGGASTFSFRTSFFYFAT
jgi:hypothetical protein